MSQLAKPLHFLSEKKNAFLVNTEMGNRLNILFAILPRGKLVKKLFSLSIRSFYIWLYVQMTKYRVTRDVGLPIVLIMAFAHGHCQIGASCSVQA